MMGVFLQDIPNGNDTMSQKIRVAVLFGGQSGEHEVSLVSAHAVMAALDPAKYDVMPIGITRDGRWLASTGDGPEGVWHHLVSLADRTKLPSDMARQLDVQEQDASVNEVAAVSLVNEQMPRALAEEVTSPHHVLPIRPRFRSAITTPQGALRDIDVVFPVLHGPMGEDGTVQGLLELAGVPYIGCGVLASAVGMDKALMKAAFAAASLPVLPWLLVRRGEWQSDAEAVYRLIEQHLQYPVFVKPANMGSSVGVSKASDRATLEAGMAEAARYDRRIVVEQGIAAREIEISVLGNEQLETSVAGEIIPSGEWYDYAAKYIDGESQTVIPAQITAEVADQVRRAATQAFAALDCAGLARVDFLLDKSSGELWLNEVNTMPGFTSISMYAKLWEASGLSYSALVDRLVALALERKG